MRSAIPRPILLAIALLTAETAPASPTWPSVSGASPQDGIWSMLPPPTTRTGHSAIYDPARDRMIVFGGADYTKTLWNDTWQLPLSNPAVWTEIVTSGTPPPPSNAHVAIYDPQRDRMVVFGPGSNDTWALALSGTPTWSQIAASGTPPPALLWATAIYDPVHDRMIVFGGRAVGSPQDLNRAWALSFTPDPTWSEITPSGPLPPGRHRHTAVYDPARERMIVFGGHLINVGTLNDTWALPLTPNATWIQLLPNGSPPEARYGHYAICDPAGDRMIMFGGYGYPGYFRDTWQLSLEDPPSWSQLATSGRPGYGSGAAAVYDPVASRAVVFWGQPAGYTETLTLSGGPTWRTLVGSGGTPGVRYGHTALYDPLRDRLLFFGGVEIQPYLSAYRGDTWALSLPGNPTWSLLAAPGSGPVSRAWHAAVYDGRRDRMIVIGGSDGDSLLDDVWAFSFAEPVAWMRLTPSGATPSARFRHTAVYDPVGDRVVLFGGNDGERRNDVWMLSPADPPAWTEAAPSGTPPTPRDFHSAVYDAVGHAMIVFGGGDESPSLHNDVWILALGETPAWIPCAPSGAPPAARESQAALYDPVRQRLIIVGGWDGTHLLNDAWALTLADPQAWSALAPDGMAPLGRESHSVAYDALRDRLLLFGGYAYDDRYDVWALTWASPVAVPQLPVAGNRSLIRTVAPNPFGSRTVIRYLVPAEGHVELEVFDIAGRRIRTLASGARSGGQWETPWDGRDRDGREVRTGVYIVRLSAPGGSAAARIALIR